MTPELTALALAALWQTIQFVLFALPANLELTPAYTTSPRDTPPPRALSKVTARLQRALNNHFEGLILFTIAVLVTVQSGQSTPFSAACAWTYLAARVAYVPAYALGWAPLRSLIWSAGFFATNAMLIAALI
ncbi:MAPEG family protein [Stagnihabitans tardus]|uniref:MAPEG family protein n=1 Tax=Stagnihabitans tardus TaxID=2699202 RepID=A0AAE5BVV1_9RHOB|nr:MAPEG family protein [Stagnihabitans tardus]NBZ87633.1 MAPEG family protein [Stagnihabitans tardus]